jgi:predicted MPP superfamily phosphohydrolase
VASEGEGGTSLAPTPQAGATAGGLDAGPGRRFQPLTEREASRNRMLRLLHTADVHLGARHTDLGEQAAAQRERQFAAFKATIDLALAEKVDIVLIAGDLFDSNSQPKRSVDRVVAELKRLAESKIRTVIIPGTHDVYAPTTSRPWPRRRPATRWSRSSPRNDLTSTSPPATQWSLPASSTRSALPRVP